MKIAVLCGRLAFIRRSICHSISASNIPNLSHTDYA